MNLTMLFSLLEEVMALRASHPDLHTAAGRAPVEGELVSLLNKVSSMFQGAPVTAEALADAGDRTERAHDANQE